MAEHFGELAAAQAFTGAELLVVDQSAETRRTTLSDVRDYVFGRDVVLDFGSVNQDMKIRFAETGFQGAFIGYDGAGNNTLTLGVHDTTSSDPADDVIAMSIGRSNGDIYFGAAGSVKFDASQNGFDFPDAVSATPSLSIGNSNDLRVYHDGTNSYVYNTTGVLYLQCQSSNVVLRSGSNDSVILDQNELLTANHGLTVNTTARSDALVVDDTSGQVGIGTAPSSAFHVNSGTTNAAARFQSTDSIVQIQMQDSDALGTLNYTGSVNLLWTASTLRADSGLTINTTARSNAFVVADATGNAGVGGTSGTAGHYFIARGSTAGQQASIVVSNDNGSNTASDAYFHLNRTTGGGDAAVRFTENWSSDWALGVDATDGAFKLARGANPSSTDVALVINTSEFVKVNHGFQVDTTARSSVLSIDDSNGRMRVGTDGGYDSYTYFYSSSAGTYFEIQAQSGLSQLVSRAGAFYLDTTGSGSDMFFQVNGTTALTFREGTHLAIFTGDVVPASDSTLDLGSASLRYSQAHIRQIDSGGNTLVLRSSATDALSINTSQLVTCHQGLRVDTTSLSSAFLVDDTTGNVGVGAVSTSTGFKFRVHNPTASESATLLISQSDGTNASNHARLDLSCAAGGGDPHIRAYAGSDFWAFGMDQSDSGAFKICNGSFIGSSVAMTISTDELVRCHKGLRIDTTGYGSQTLTVDDSSGVTTVRGGCVLSPVASDPGSLVNGQLWITDAGELKFRANGITKTATAS